MKSYTNMLVILMIFLVLFVFVGKFSSAQVRDEAAVREVFELFRDGINRGDKAIGTRLATDEFSSSFVPFYGMLVDAYRQAKIDFPIEIKHLRILNDGRAKVETYLNPGRDLIVFTLKKERDEWKICHSEGILFEIYSIPSIPYQEVYRIPDEKRGWMMAERDVAFQCRVYDRIKSLKGETYARDFFLDGPGYKAMIDAWLPFVEGAAQFALFYAIVEKNYYGAHYVVTKATLDEAEIQCNPLIELDVLRKCSFYPKLTIEEYKELFTSIMKQRAEYCGLDIAISFADISCIIQLRRLAEMN